MTKEQEKALNKIRILTGKLLYGDEYEIKTFEVKEYADFISVYIVTGVKNDNGTAAFICRDYAHVFIGKRGGVTYPVSGRKGQTTRRFKWASLLQVVIDQR